VYSYRMWSLIALDARWQLWQAQRCVQVLLQPRDEAPVQRGGHDDELQITPLRLHALEQERQRQIDLHGTEGLASS
jgi:hypothetical protein